jgi:hypothetical protein
VQRRLYRPLARLRGRRYNTDIDAVFFRELTLVSDLLSDAGVMNPGIAFAVFRRRDGSATE